MPNVIELATALVNRASVTPEDAGCQAFIADFLKARGFEIQHLPFGQVKNIWATRGHTKPVFCFLGHTDVVPSGDESKWQSPPFDAQIRDGKLYGRGTTDMKGAIAAMLCAIDTFLTGHEQHESTLAILLTSDEEGPAVDGTVKVIDYLKSNNIELDYCLIGEPTSQHELGDMIKNGRRGSLSGTLTIHGKQGHIAYPHLAHNPIPDSLPVIKTLCETHWDDGDADFQATSFQIANVNAGTGASNMIPSEIIINFNFRFNTCHTAESLQTQVDTILKQFNDLNYDIQWTHYGNPFVTQEGQLLTAAQEAIKTVTGKPPACSTSGGTSDGRFIAPHMPTEIVECGTLNHSAHHRDEHVGVEDLHQLTKIYNVLLNNLMTQS